MYALVTFWDINWGPRPLNDNNVGGADPNSDGLHRLAEVVIGSYKVAVPSQSTSKKGKDPLESDENCC